MRETKGEGERRGYNRRAENPLHVDCFLPFIFLFFSLLLEVLGSARAEGYVKGRDDVKVLFSAHRYVKRYFLGRST